MVEAGLGYDCRKYWSVLVLVMFIKIFFFVAFSATHQRDGIENNATDFAIAIEMNGQHLYMFKITDNRLISRELR